jgi:hypothetical protein
MLKWNLAAVRAMEMDLMTGLINLAAAVLAFGMVAIGLFKKSSK